MDKVRLQDSNTQLRFICDDLRAIQTVMAIIEGEEAVSCEREALMVVLRALEPIIQDVEKVVQALESELNRESSV